MKMKITALITCLFYFVTVCYSQHHSVNTLNQHSNESFGYADSVNTGLIIKDTLKGSVQRTAMLTIGGCHLHIKYGSPGVRGRVIWGGLVPYNEVWVTGAHNATSMSASKPFRIGSMTLSAGTYAIFIIPGKDQWTFIINKNIDQHLADDYKQAEDLVRIIVLPQAHGMTQRLTYAITDLGHNSGTISIRWENLSIFVPFETL